MTIIKKSSLALLSIGLMLTVAGYINYKYNPEREKDLGQTIYVNGKDNFNTDNVSIYSDDKVKKTDESSIAVFKYDRDNMFSEQIETYNKMINNEFSTKEKVNEYQTQLNKLIKEKNLITMVENVIKAKGIEDIVIIPTNNDNINVVVKSKEELKPEQVAKIQQILVDQLGANAKKLSITVNK